MKFKLLACVAALTSVLIIDPTIACTRILKADHVPAVMVGRNMDWNIAKRVDANIWVYPRGIQRNGFTSVNPIKWHAKYGSVAATVFDALTPVTTDGMNEEGLAVHINALHVADYGERNHNVPGLSVLMWAQYYLDNFKTVDEAVKATASNAFQIVTFRDPISGRAANGHLGIEDATGDSAIVEYVNGQLHIYHDRANTAMTNDPVYSEQLTNLKQYHGFGGSKPLPGTSKPEDRFVRASYYAAYMPEYEDVGDELSAIFGILQNVAHPAGKISEDDPTGSKTMWSSVCDLTNHTYYFMNMKGLKLMHLSLNQFDLREGSKPMRLIVQNREDLAGDVSKLFEPMS
jgi:choloylglycine hydrolase